MADAEAQPLAHINETVLKKRKNNEEWALKRRQQIASRKQTKIDRSKSIIKSPEQFVQEYRAKELDYFQSKRRLKIRKLSQDDMKSKLLFVIRIQGSTDMHPRTRKILNEMRLRQIMNGVFVKVNESNLKKILTVEPFITYGYPNLKSIRELIHKKGVGKIENQRIPLTNNNVIEQAFGKYGILCLEDLVHEITSVGPHFKDVTRFLWPFRLKKPHSIHPFKKKHFKDGGDSGNREDRINEFIDKLN